MKSQTDRSGAPVAWRCRYVSGDGKPGAWVPTCHLKTVEARRKFGGWEIEPLFADQPKPSQKSVFWLAVVVKFVACVWVGFMLTAAVRPADGLGGVLCIWTALALFLFTLPIEVEDR